MLLRIREIRLFELRRVRGWGQGFFLIYITVWVWIGASTPVVWLGPVRVRVRVGVRSSTPVVWLGPVRVRVGVRASTPVVWLGPVRVRVRVGVRASTPVVWLGSAVPAQPPRY